ncbi:MAG: AI-2E family transporter [Chloroflexota bacterium]|nr:AI-2E family transporter [Chloroflexota bacterium]
MSNLLRRLLRPSEGDRSDGEGRRKQRPRPQQLEAPQLAPQPIPVAGGRSDVTVISLRVTLVVVGVLLLLLAAYMLQMLLLLTIVALILAAAMHDPALAIERRGVTRPVAIALAYSALVGAIIAVLLLIAGPLVSQLQNLVENGPQIIGEMRAQAVSFIDGIIGAGAGEELFARLGAAFENVDLGEALQLPLRLAEALVNVLLILFLSAFFVLERDRARNWTVPFLDPAKRGPAVELSRAVGRSLGRFVHAQLLLMTIVGIGMALALSVLGVPFALPLGLFAFLVEAIPMLGPWIALVPAALFAFAEGPVQGLLLLAFWFVLQQVESYVLTPTVMGHVQRLSATVVLLSVLAGFQLFGIVGALIAVPVVAAVGIVIEGVLRPARAEGLNQ